MQFTLAHKISLLVVAAALATGIAVASDNYVRAADDLRAQAGNGLSALLEARRVAIEDYLASIRRDLSSEADNPFVLEGFNSFRVGWQELGDVASKRLRALYFDGNRFGPGARQMLDNANDPSLYSLAHNRFHPRLRSFAEQYGYRDLVLIDRDGTILYSVMKQSDFAANIMGEPYASTGLGKVFAAIAADPEHQRVAVSDIEHYAPSQGRPTGFIAAPLFDDTHNFIGVLAFEMPIDRINKVMQVAAGLGQSGDSFIVGSDHLLRSDSRHSPVPTLLVRRVDNEPVRTALDGRKGLMVTSVQEPQGPVELLVAYAPLEFVSERWAVVATADLSEVYAPVDRMRERALAHGVLATVLIVLLGLMVTRRWVVAPLTAVTAAMRSIAAGDRATPIPVLGRKDEIGDIARTLELFRDSLIDRDRLSGHLATAITAYGGGLALFDTDERLLMANDGLYSLVPSLAVEALPEQTLSTFIDAANLSGRVVSEDGSGGPLEIETIRRNPFDSLVHLGTDRWADLSARSTPDGGILLVMNDVTGHKRAADAYRQALDKERELGMLQREFVSMTSHEFRTPLAIIDAAVQRMVRRHGVLSETDHADLGQTIRDAVGRMVGLIEAILSSSRLDAGELRFSPQTITLAGLIRDVARGQDAISPAHRFIIDLEDLPDQITADKTLLHQVFTNIISNAAKYSPSGGDIKIEGWTDNYFCYISITDHGVGISSSDLPRISQRFFRARTSVGIVGTGIGLDLVRRLLDMHGGRLDIASIEGEGSTFTVVLPLHPPSKALGTVQRTSIDD